MSFQTLYRAKAFGPGADLWILPDSKSSPMAKKIDWYLNFQIARSELHVVRPISPELKKVIVENDLGLPDVENRTNPPLLVAADTHFPTSKIIELKVQASLQGWVEQIQSLWLKLRKPRLRVFLPNDLTPEDFQKLWGTKFETQLSEELTLVPR